MKWFVLLFVTNLLVYVYSASIFDLLTLDPEGRDEDDVDISDSSEEKKNCLCNGPSCICCVDFNMTIIDLGGPGCVRLNYISPDEGIAINVSYGDTSLHSETVKGPDPAPTCLTLFAKLAQMCARFSELLPTDDGLRGCLQLEPVILGEVQIELPIGCFRMGPNGMTVIESSNQVIKEQETNDETTIITDLAEEKPENIDGKPTQTDGLAGFNTADIIAAVNESAEEGIALITNWLGLNVNKLNKPNTTETKEQEIKEKTEETDTTIQKRL